MGFARPDLAVIDTSTFGITYATGLMNLCMDVAVKTPVPEYRGYRHGWHE